MMTRSIEESVSVSWLWPRKTKAGLFAYAFFVFSLFLAYVLILSPMYSYSLLTYKPSIPKLAISIICILLSLWLFPRDEEKPSTYLYLIYYSLTYIPTATYYWLNDQPTLFFLYETICFVLIAIMLRIPMRRFAVKAKLAKICIQSIFVFYILACVYLVYKNGGIHLGGLLKNLYQVRGENSFSGVSGYILNWCAKAFMPFFFVYFFLKRRWIGMTITAILQAALFASYGFKAFLMAIALLIGVSLLMRRPENFKNKWIKILTIGNLACIFISKTITSMPINIFSYRTLFLPAQGQFEYYDFFTHNEFLRFSEGSIGRLLGSHYPYNESIGRIVNLYIYGGTKISNGNTGALSYGFADFGFWGMILAALTIAFVLLLVDKGTANIPLSIPVGAMAYQMFILNDNSILICLNTGGLLWTLMMLVLLNSVYPSFKEERMLKRLQI